MLVGDWWFRLYKKKNMEMFDVLRPLSKDLVVFYFIFVDACPAFCVWSCGVCECRGYFNVLLLAKLTSILKGFVAIALTPNKNTSSHNLVFFFCLFYFLSMVVDELPFCLTVHVLYLLCECIFFSFVCFQKNISLFVVTTSPVSLLYWL